MHILVIGNGGREHAIAWRLSQDQDVKKVYVSPGNGGTTTGKLQNIQGSCIEDWLQIAIDKKIALTVVGPETHLKDGIQDSFKKHNLLLLGPSKKAAQLETSKIYCKELLDDIKVATAPWQKVTCIADAKNFIEKTKEPYVIKADGLAAGKGVEIAQNKEEALAITTSFLNGKHGAASKQLVIEKYIKGKEVSLFALCDGKIANVLLPCRDYKRLLDNDQGPNTGGMGAVCPIDVNQEELAKKCLYPVFDELTKQGIAYQGFLYAGLIIDENNKPWVLEFNVRLGDPEAQVLLPLWQGNFADTLVKAAKGTMSKAMISFSAKASVCVVLAAKTYPIANSVAAPLTIPTTDAGDMIFHAGTAINDKGDLVTNGGRLLGISCCRVTISAASKAVYAIAQQAVDNTQNRNDIAQDVDN